MIKKLMSVLGVALFVSVAFISTGLAQETAPTMIRGGVLNGKAIKLPKPAYPEAAKLDRAGGPVSVTVTIDEEGNVIEAKAAEEYKRPGNSDGEGMVTIPVHPALQEAAEKAAWEAKFSPTKLSGVPVKVKGLITYNFVPGGSERLDNGPESGVGNGAAEIKPLSRAVSGGVLNRRATYLPAPVYPSIPNDVRGVGGAVTVQVVIDENGVVTSANAVSGHPLLRAAAVDAAKQAQFSPTFLSGRRLRYRVS